MAEVPDPKVLQEQLRSNWAAYVDLLIPLRPELYAYCRRLTRNVWDAEDLVQETLIRGFSHLGHLGQDVGNLRAYMLRAASNTWIDSARRRATEDRLLEERPPAPPASSKPDERVEIRDAGARLMHRLAPQERAAVVLKDVFELTAREIAAVLATTEGAVKDALHRGRGRLRESDDVPARRATPSVELVDRFLELYDAKDVPGLVDLLAEGGSASNLGFGLQYGSEAFEGTENFLYKVVHGHEEWPDFMRPDSERMVRAEFEGEPVLLRFAVRHGDEALELMMRFEESDGKIARILSYGFCPETMREAAAALGCEVRTGAYRVPDFDMTS